MKPVLPLSQKMLKWLFALLILFCHGITTAQVFPLKLGGTVHNNGKKLQGVKVTLYHGNEKLLSKTSEKDGWFGYVKPEVDGKYKLFFEYENMVKIHYTISTELPKNMSGGVYTFDMGKVEMYNNIDGLDLSVFIKPVGKVIFYSDRKTFDYIPEHKTARIKEIKNAYDNIGKEPDLIAENNNNNNNSEEDNQEKTNDKNGADKDIDPNTLEGNNNNELPEDEIPVNINLNNQLDNKSVEDYIADIDAKKASGDKKAVGDLQHKLGKKLFSSGDLPRAKENLNEALLLKEEQGDNEGASEVLNDLAKLNFDNGDFEDAIDDYEKAADLKLMTGDQRGAANILTDMGLMAADIYRFDKAADQFRMALDIVQELGDKPGETAILNNLGNLYFEKGDYDKALNFYQQSLDIDKGLGNNNDVAAMLNNMGVTLHHKGDLNDAINAYEESIDVSEEIGNDKEVSISLNNIGNVNFDWQKYSEALDYYLKSLKIKEDIQYSKGIALTFHNIGNVHNALKEFEDALEFYNKSNNLAKELELNDLIQKNYKAISNVYYEMKDCKNAYDYYKLFSKSSEGMPVIRSGQLSEFQFKQANLESAVGSRVAELKEEVQKQKMLAKFHSQSTLLQIELKNKELEEQNLKSQAQKRIIYLLIGGAILFIIFILILLRTIQQKKKTNILLEKGKREIEEKSGELLIVNKELNKLSIVARETDNAIMITDPDGRIEWVNEGFTRLLGYNLPEFREKFGDNLTDSSSNPDIKNLLCKSIKEKTSVEYLSTSTTKDGRKIWLQTTITPVFDKNGNITELVAIDSDVSKIKSAEEEVTAQQKELVKAFKQSSRQQIALHKAMIQIENQKDEITDSIQYASRIQTAIFPPTKMFDNVLPEYFILNKPRDIVSGDFYWCSKVGNKSLVAAADCTGHGVPGAFMSLLGVNFMNEIINNYDKQKIADVNANDILNKLRNHVISALRQTGEFDEKDGKPVTHSFTNVKDGMDISLCVLDHDNNKLQYSGANNPLYLVRKKGKGTESPYKLSVYKADKMPIGIHTLNDKGFKNNEIDLLKGDTFYLFSDGYIDQFGGPKGKKFKSRYFRKVLEEIQENKMSRQKELLEETLSNWQGDHDQIDDILVIGVRV